MKLSKFESMVQNKGLYFTRADMLGDDFEGSYPLKNVENRPETFANLGLPEQNWDNVTAYFEKLRCATACNCWFKKEYESAVMWRSFTGWQEGVLIQSTFGKLAACLDASDIDKEQLHVGRVKYLDYDSDTIPEWNALAPFIHKRRFYDDEHEVRAIVLPPLGGEGALIPDVSKEIQGNGQFYEIELANLIDKIYVAPGADDGYRDQVLDLCGKYLPSSVAIRVEFSEIKGKPSF